MVARRRLQSCLRSLAVVALLAQAAGCVCAFLARGLATSSSLRGGGALARSPRVSRRFFWGDDGAAEREAEELRLRLEAEEAEKKNSELRRNLLIGGGGAAALFFLSQTVSQEEVKKLVGGGAANVPAVAVGGGAALAPAAASKKAADLAEDSKRGERARAKEAEILKVREEAKKKSEAAVANKLKKEAEEERKLKESKEKKAKAVQDEINAKVEKKKREEAEYEKKRAAEEAERAARGDNLPNIFQLGLIGGAAVYFTKGGKKKDAEAAPSKPAAATPAPAAPAPAAAAPEAPTTTPASPMAGTEDKAVSTYDSVLLQPMLKRLQDDAGGKA